MEAIQLYDATRGDLQEALDTNAERLEYGLEMVREEVAYRKAKRIAAFKLKQQGFPISLIEMTLKGEPSVIEHYEAWQTAKVHYEIALEEINILKKSAQVLENQNQREWTS